MCASCIPVKNDADSQHDYHNDAHCDEQPVPDGQRLYVTKAK